MVTFWDDAQDLAVMFKAVMVYNERIENEIKKKRYIPMPNDIGKVLAVFFHLGSFRPVYFFQDCHVIS